MGWAVRAATVAMAAMLGAGAIGGPAATATPAPPAGDPSGSASSVEVPLGSARNVGAAVDPATGRVLVLANGLALYEPDGTAVALPEGFPTGGAKVVASGGAFYVEHGDAFTRIDPVTLSFRRYSHPWGLVFLFVGATETSAWYAIDTQGYTYPRHALYQIDLDSGAVVRRNSTYSYGWAVDGGETLLLRAPGGIPRIERLQANDTLASGGDLGTFPADRIVLAPGGEYAYVGDGSTSLWREVRLDPAGDELTGRTFTASTLALGPAPQRLVAARSANQLVVYRADETEPALRVGLPVVGGLNGRPVGIGGPASTVAYAYDEFNDGSSTMPAALWLTRVAPDLGAPEPAVVGSAGGAEVTIPFQGIAPSSVEVGGTEVAAASNANQLSFAAPALAPGVHLVHPVGTSDGESDPLQVVELGPYGTVPGFVGRQYADVLGRAPTASELSAATSALTAGDPAGTVPADLVRALPLAAKDASLIRLYRAVFQRVPDTSGYRYWLARLDGGTTLGRAAATFAASSEFQRTYGKLGDGAFVDLVYQNVLGRAPDPGGRAFWLRKLAAGTSRGTLVAQFSQSSEYVRKTTALVERSRLVLAMFDRMPKQAELDFVGALTLEQVAQSLLTASQYPAS